MVFSLLHKDDVEREEAATGKSEPAEQQDAKGDKYENEDEFRPSADDLD